MKDSIEQSKWVKENQGPFQVVRQTRGGAYILEDRTGHILGTRFPPKALKIVPGAEFVRDMQQPSFYVSKILEHEKLANGSMKYLVKFKNVVEPKWIGADDFDGSILIAKYWKTRMKQDGQRLGVGDVEN